jgi:hypothetical protein
MGQSDQSCFVGLGTREPITPGLHGPSVLMGRTNKKRNKTAIKRRLKKFGVRYWVKWTLLLGFAALFLYQIAVC